MQRPDKSIDCGTDCRPVYRSFRLTWCQLKTVIALLAIAYLAWQELGGF